jgi:hypothetical protein
MNQKHPAVPGAVGQGSTFDTRRWRGVDRAGAVGRRDEAIRRLSEQGWSRREISAELGVSFFVVARAQRAGGAS